MNNSTAILFFSRSAEKEARHKRLLTPYKANKKIYGAFIAHTEKVLKNTGLPYFIFDEQQQTGNSFGQKLCNGIKSVFTKGYAKVIVVGNDCLQLNAGTINNTANYLETDELVLGPSNSGGVYLIGITQCAFNAVNLENIHWQTSSVFKELKNIAVHFSHRCLSVLADINTRKELIQAQKYLRKFHRLLIYINSIITSLGNKQNQLYYKLSPCYTLSCSGISPPPYYL